MEFEAASNGESLNNPDSANMSLPSTTDGEILVATPYVSGNILIGKAWSHCQKWWGNQCYKQWGASRWWTVLVTIISQAMESGLVLLPAWATRFFPALMISLFVIDRIMSILYSSRSHCKVSSMSRLIWKSSFQNFEQEIVFLNHGPQDANLAIANDDDIDLDKVLWIEPCLPFSNSLFGHHDDPFFQLLIDDSAEVLPEDCAKQVNCSLPVTGAVAKLSSFRKSIAMATKLLATDSHTPNADFALLPHNFHWKCLLLISIGGEVSSAANDCVRLFSTLTYRWICGGSLLFDPHGFVPSASVLSSGETMDITTQCFPTVLFYWFGNSPVTARSSTMARQIRGEMDTVQAGTFDIQKN